MTTARYIGGEFSADEVATIGAIRSAAERRSSDGAPTSIDDRFWLQVRLEGVDRGGLRRVPPLKVSPTGISYIWTEPVAPGVVATFVMLDRLGLPMTVKGSVMRCRHHRGRLYEVAAAFARPVDVDMFLGKEADAVDAVQRADPAAGHRTRGYRRAAFDAIFDRIAQLTSLNQAAAVQ